LWWVAKEKKQIRLSPAAQLMNVGQDIGSLLASLPHDPPPPSGAGGVLGRGGGADVGRGPDARGRDDAGGRIFTATATHSRCGDGRRTREDRIRSKSKCNL
jgi:hypothetical protein